MGGGGGGGGHTVLSIGHGAERQLSPDSQFYFERISPQLLHK